MKFSIVFAAMAAISFAAVAASPAPAANWPSAGSGANTKTPANAAPANAAPAMPSGHPAMGGNTPPPGHPAMGGDKAAPPGGHAGGAAAAAPLTKKAKAISVLDAKTFTYIEIKENGKSQWIASPQVSVKPGDNFSYAAGELMPKFHSKALNRDFTNVLLTSRVVVDK